MSDDKTYYARVTPCRVGYSVRVCVRIAEVEADWLEMADAAGRWCLTRRGAERLGRRLVDRRIASAAREASSTTVEGTMTT